MDQLSFYTFGNMKLPQLKQAALKPISIFTNLSSKFQTIIPFLSDLGTEINLRTVQG